MKCKDCGKSFTYLDICNWMVRCCLMGITQIIGYCQGGGDDSMCNRSNQNLLDRDCDQGM